MPIIPSTRLRGHVVFHCPTCFADRVGKVRRGPSSRPGEQPNADEYVECVACAAQISGCALTRPPVGISFTSQMMAAARSVAAAVVIAGGRDEQAIVDAVRFVEQFSGLDFSGDELVVDLIDPLLSIRLRGDMLLVAESLTTSGAAEFVDGMTALASGRDRVHEALAVVGACRRLIGAGTEPRRRRWRVGRQRDD